MPEKTTVKFKVGRLMQSVLDGEEYDGHEYAEADGSSGDNGGSRQ